MQTTEYARRLQDLAQGVRRVRDKAEELFEHTPMELESGAREDLMEEIRKISEMLREDLEAALERAERVTQMTEMLLLIRGVARSEDQQKGPGEKGGKPGPLAK